VNLATFLAEVAANNDRTMMDTNNIATVIVISGNKQAICAHTVLLQAPNLLRNPDNDPVLFARNSDAEKNFFQLVLRATMEGILQ
jgi:hypothetical protein